MTAPFRDDLAAALDHAEQLADENRRLREELERLRGKPSTLPSEEPPQPPPAPRPATESPPESMKERTLERLERLSHEIDAHAAQVEPRAPPAPPPPRPSPPPPPPWGLHHPNDVPSFDAHAAAPVPLASLRRENAALRAQELATRRFTWRLAMGGVMIGIVLGWVLGAAVR